MQASLTSNSNVPVSNGAYTQPDNRSWPCSEKREALAALGDGHISATGKGGCSVRQVIGCASSFAQDKLFRTACSEMENNVINATMCDPKSPSPVHCEAIIKYVVCSDDASNGLNVATYLLKRLEGANSIVTAKVLLLTHRLVTLADVKFIRPLQQQVAAGSKCMGALSAQCKLRPQGGPNCDGGAALPLLEIYAAYIHALSQHILNVTSVIGANIFKEKIHNNTFLNRMEMDATMADLVRQSTEVLMIISAVPVTRELFHLEITRRLFESLIIDALCLYGFDSKALENAFIFRKGTTTKSGLQKWLRTFQAYENAGHALNNFFDKIAALRVELPVKIPSLYVPAEGTASRIRLAMASILAMEGAVDECLIDDALATAQLEAGLESPASVCYRKRCETQRSSVTSVSSPLRGALTDSQGASNSGNSTVSSSSAGGVITGFHIPADRAEFTIQRNLTTIMSDPNSLNSEFTMNVTMTATDPLSSPQSNSDGTEGKSPRFTDEAQNARFVIFTDDVLGRGSFGVVYRAWDEEDGRHVACKEIVHHTRKDSRTPQGGGAISEVASPLRGEFELLTSLTHGNIVSVFAFQAEPTVSRIFMEWVPGGSVQDIFRRTGKGLSQSVIRKYITGALKGLAYMHERGIVHRDIKPGNMLIDANGGIKLTDFGTSKWVHAVGAGDGGFGSPSQENAATKSVVGTIPYLSPESFRGIYGPHSDVWAIGASAVHMYTGRVPWSEKQFSDALQLIFHIGSAREPNHHPSYTAQSDTLMAPKGDFFSFLNDCFTFAHEKRPSAADLLNHPFIVNDVQTPL